ncbi:MAG: PLP-dependent aspartate aminotransferase family protein [Candidatus Aminicenantes bacterium]|nr:PLP-dependent aspartate aminotransferase family protein [Candidatus Aminicenantes bacterium]
MKNLSKKAFLTRAVHAGERVPLGKHTPVGTPIHPSVSYFYETMENLDAAFEGRQEGYVYLRYGSPTVAAFEAAVAELEQGEACQAFSSGMAAIHAALLAAGVRSGTTILTTLDLYGATTTLLQRYFTEMGVNVRLVDLTHLGALEAIVADTHPVALLVETISNPLMKVTDIPTLIKLAHRYGAKVLVDNTFASPYLYNPFLHHADYVIHSVTKYIGGHGDVMGGVVISSTENRKKLNDLNRLVGGILGPFEAWLALRGCKTLPLRVREQCANAARMAQWLADQPRVDRVNYPGLQNHPQHDLASRLFGKRGFGGMLSFEIAKADRTAVFRFMDSLELCLPAATMGDIYTLVLHPATASHRSLSAEERARAGINEGLVRISAGIEDVNDLIADLEQAFKAIS